MKTLFEVVGVEVVWLSRKQVAGILGVSARTIQRYCGYLRDLNLEGFDNTHQRGFSWESANVLFIFGSLVKERNVVDAVHGIIEYMSKKDEQ